MSKWYVGILRGTSKTVAFKTTNIPTKETHNKFGFFIGPFITQKGAEYAARVGPKVSIQGISHYEKLAKEE
jgi:hypothetical protein